MAGSAMALVRTPEQHPAHAELLAGLLSVPKTLPSKYLYDEEGSRLFELICDQPEYYVARTEISLLASIAAEVAHALRDRSVLVEFGSGASVKTRLLLDALPLLSAYVPIDISQSALSAAALAIRGDYPRLNVMPVLGDFTRHLTLPTTIDGRSIAGFFPGSTIGNFSPSAAVDFLARVRRLFGQGSKLVVGADLAKTPRVLVPAYNDAEGVTAAFNKNLLTRLNREFGANFDLGSFDHVASWNAAESRIEMHLVSLVRQRVTLLHRWLDFAAGETIHTENSYKYSPVAFARMAAQAGWSVERRWISDNPEFAIFALSAD
ncbi:L-histidine N(alpha)-methyltransferase [Bradyrhizobium sp. U87765 SZCCT0131]|uniref:L-histidine N(alpha)-methyltransferase n=1 Tax=unclassified Bradyrhizobium TaxID=2631580 RepID=UPI001BA978A3|nr:MULTISPECIES: L-histidine N(alpha)-methyltransferase [unclassified Bradyrhizobium]MBR1216540.1 L-histidine N(alpha)-methyltransferase [Bradyrhizobium sp. U87765 SZCCT0131]MBR1259704.1 L-histidine N(alpha)-methyltransferase [Bradyrhizobium sp. U87765 SZCCT0134]MBR1305845.1 L-histidine N(alpha)-methyltransferase [Bradyrhizobium sp. U87765 SZCCT0110]MBR1322212.1 L-histidine N(alpha)-methyltransferase [Bradyrhizobium sp. U87765 SZCCT0109]MBR1350509.1 L-histidine N(alpha)-methyltransferase [Brad